MSKVVRNKEALENKRFKKIKKLKSEYKQVKERKYNIYMYLGTIF